LIEYSVRPMFLEDLDEVMIIEEELFSDRWNREMFISEVESQIALIIEVNNKIAGFLCAWKVIDEVSITNVGVRKEYQNQGLAFNVLEQFIIEEKKLGTNSFFLEVRTSNLPAINLYKKLQFRMFQIRKNYYENPSEDAIVMGLIEKEKKINESL